MLPVATLHANLRADELSSVGVDVQADCIVLAYEGEAIALTGEQFQGLLRRRAAGEQFLDRAAVLAALESQDSDDAHD